MGLDEKGSSSKCTPARVKNCLKTFLVHLFSHVGLCVLVVGYAVIGGFIFREIEDQSEEDEKLEAELADAVLNATRRHHVSNLWLITDRFNVLYESNWTLEVEAELEKFERAVRDRKETRVSVKWTFTSALLYSVSIITTIGYGTLVPKTLAGKMFTMLYAVIGVPIMLLWVSNIGNVMAHAFKFAYFHAPCCGSSSSARSGGGKNEGLSRKTTQSRPSKEKSKLEKSPSSALPPGNSESGAGGGHPTQIEFSICNEKCETVLLEEPTPHSPSSSSRSPSTPTKRSHGKKSLRELDPSARRILFECAEYNFSEGDERSRELLQQLAYEGDEVDDAGSKSSDIESVIEMSGGHRRFSGSSMIPPPPIFDGDYPEEEERSKIYGFPPPVKNGSRRVSVIESLQVPHGTPSRVPLLADRDVIDVEIEPWEGSPGGNRDNYSNFTEKRVPVSLVLLVVVLYILLGAAVFKAQEKWPFWDSVYFCFITLSTIGLGDMTPGKSLEHSGTRESTVRLVFCCFYLVIGLAIIAMSFNLVQEQVTIKVTEFARRVGIIEDEYS